MDLNEGRQPVAPHAPSQPEQPGSPCAGGAPVLRLVPRPDADSLSAPLPATPPVARPATLPVALPLPPDLTLVTDLAELMWSIVRRDIRSGDRTSVGMIQRRGEGFEVTVLGDPIRMISTSSLTESIAVVVSAAAPRRKPGQGTTRRRA